MIVPLIKKLRSILSNKRHCLKEAFQERTLPKVNQQCLETLYEAFQRCIRCKDTSMSAGYRDKCAILPALALRNLHVEVKGELNKQKYCTN